MSTKEENERDKAVERVVNSRHRRRVVVAGPGTGKTSLFRKVLQSLPPGDRKQRVVLTFISKLKAELDTDLGLDAVVQTFHGFCRALLHRSAGLRGASLSEDFCYFPALVTLVKSDWSSIRGGEAPKFVPALRNLEVNDEISFFEERANYYDAIGFEDSVWRVATAIARSNANTPRYELVIIDEFQDLTHSEVMLLRQIGTKSPLLIAGDDDQALYGTLRGANETYIRELYADAESEQHCLPFCMRCPSLIVNAANDVVSKAVAAGRLGGRIDKPFKPLVPATLGPRIRVVKTTVQSPSANYFGKYIHQQIQAISRDDIRESREKGFPTALVIGPSRYLDQVRAHLEKTLGLSPAAEKGDLFAIERDSGVSLLHKNKNANLGWRIVLEADNPAWRRSVIKASGDNTPLYDLIPEPYRAEILAEADAWVEPEETPVPEVTADISTPTVELVSFEKSKGLSAQHVFIVGLQEGSVPGKNLRDVDVCKFLVALTRTRKRCHLIYTARQGGQPSRASRFIQWISEDKKESVVVNKGYWQ